MYSQNLDIFVADLFYNKLYRPIQSFPLTYAFFFLVCSPRLLVRGFASFLTLEAFSHSLVLKLMIAVHIH